MLELYFPEDARYVDAFLTALSLRIYDGFDVPSWAQYADVLPRRTVFEWYDPRIAVCFISDS